MSSLWWRLEGLKARGWASGQRRRHRCDCAECRPAGRAQAPVGKAELRLGFPRFAQLDGVLKVLAETLPRLLARPGLHVNSAYFRGAFRKELPTLVGIFEDLLLIADVYTVPRDPAEEKQRFTWQMWQLVARLIQNKSHPHVPWPDFVAMMSEALGTDEWSMEMLVRHHDPGLQLIHFPSFRLFAELQLLQRYLRLCVSQVMDGKDFSESAILRVYACVAATPDAVVFYAKLLGVWLPDDFVCACGPSVFLDTFQSMMRPTSSVWRKSRDKPLRQVHKPPDSAKPEESRLPPAAAGRERLSKGQRKRRARAAAKASRADESARPRSPSVDSDEAPVEPVISAAASDQHSGSEVVDTSTWAQADTGQPNCLSGSPEAAAVERSEAEEPRCRQRRRPKPQQKGATAASLLARMWQLSLSETPATAAEAQSPLDLSFAPSTAAASSV